LGALSAPVSGITVASRRKGKKKSGDSDRGRSRVASEVVLRPGPCRGTNSKGTRLSLAETATIESNPPGPITRTADGRPQGRHARAFS
jgi:hypothetical protein